MSKQCPQCKVREGSSEVRKVFVKSGFFRRRSDQKWIQRYKCKHCGKVFSQATSDPCFRQNKRHLNQQIFEQLSSGTSQRRTAYLLRINRKTVKRKFLFLGMRALCSLRKFNLRFPKAEIIEFDDLETFEHTKCKPVSVTLAVEGKTRRILGFSVSRMPSKGRLAKKSLLKYGSRPDERTQGRRSLFHGLNGLVKCDAVIKSDQNPHYILDVKSHFKEATHVTYKGRQGAITGQGELKKTVFDPLFSLNHTCAKMRADINRLIRKTWCTTKKIERLRYHLAIFSLYHNQALYSRKRV